MLDSKKRKVRFGESRVKKRTVVVRGQKTSVSMEESFWVALKKIASPITLGWQHSSQISTANANTPTCHPPSGCLFSVIIESASNQVSAVCKAKKVQQSVGVGPSGGVRQCRRSSQNSATI